MGNTLLKRCPFCGKSSGTFLQLPMEFEGGRPAESVEISLNDPFELSECFSQGSLEKLNGEAGTLRWTCGRCQIPYKLALTPLLPESTKIVLARRLCQEAIKVEEERERPAEEVKEPAEGAPIAPEGSGA